MNTRSYIMGLAASLLAVAPLQAQWEVGLQAGAGSGRINTDLFPATSRGEYQVLEQRFSWLIGGSVTHKLYGPLSFSTGMYWSFIAGHDEYWSQEVKIMAADRQIHYLCLPMVVQLNLGRFGVGVGYQLGTPLVERGTFNRFPFANGHGESSTQETNDLYLKRTDFGALGELRFRITDRMTSGIRYYFGLQNIKDPGDGYRSPLMNEQLVLTVGYNILSKRKADETPMQETVPTE